MSDYRRGPRPTHRYDERPQHHGHRKKGGKNAARRRRRRNLLIGEIVVLAFLLLGLFVASKWNLMGHETIDDKDIIVNEELPEETHEVLRGYKTIALLGVDNRVMGNYSTGNSDTIIVMNINNDTKEITMMSVYRDTYLNVYGDTYNKCNSAYNRDGALGAINMLNKNLDLNITDYISVDFKALADAVDIVGGIEVDIANDEMNEMNKFIAETEGWLGRKSAKITQTGPQVVDGIQALTYARIRKIAGNDFRRAERQRTVVGKLFEKVKQAGLTELNALIDKIFPEISTSLSFSEVVGLAMDVSNYTMGDSHGFPFDMRDKDVGSKGDCLIPCTLSDNVSKAHQFLFDVEAYVPTNQVTQISNKIQADTGFTAADAVDYGY